MKLDEVEVGMLVDYEVYPERIYRCRVLKVDERSETAEIESVLSRRGRKDRVDQGKPTLKRWVPVATLHSAGIGKQGFE